MKTQSPAYNEPAATPVSEAQNGTAIATDRIIREKECKQLTGLGRTRRWQMERAGTFPRRRKISRRISGYLLSEVLEWIRTRPVSDYEAPLAPMRARGIPPRGTPAPAQPVAVCP